jgi:coproporphyrinogen III oxidase-like Fe-S oxidoreductase
MFLGLRELTGIRPADFAARFGRSVEDVHPSVRELRAEELLAARGDRLALTERGLLFADTVFTRFV